MLSLPLVDFSPDQSPVAEHEAVFVDCQDKLIESLIYIDVEDEVKTVIEGKSWIESWPLPPPPPHEINKKTDIYLSDFMIKAKFI